MSMSEHTCIVKWTWRCVPLVAAELAVSPLNRSHMRSEWNHSLVPTFAYNTTVRVCTVSPVWTALTLFRTALAPRGHAPLAIAAAPRSNSL